MAKFDVRKMAAGLKLSSEKEPDEGDEAGPKEGDDESLGAKALAAIASKNGAAFEEAILAICGK